MKRPNLHNRIIVGDVIEQLSKFESASVDLIIADPPYNLGPTFLNGEDWVHRSDWASWCSAWLQECSRILRPSGAIVVFGIHHYLCYIQVELYKMGLKYRRQIIWHYENGFSRSKRAPATQYEPLLWFSKSESSFTYNPMYEPYKSLDRLKHTITKNGKIWTPNPSGKMIGDIWKFPTLAGRRFAAEKVDHPTQKPLNLTDRLVRCFSNPNDLLLIPFAGSGSECVSAKRLGRAFIGIEISETYANLALGRLGRVYEDTFDISS